MYVENKQALIKIIVKTDKIITKQISVKKTLYYWRNQLKTLKSCHSQVETSNERNAETQWYEFIYPKHHERKYWPRTHELNLNYQKCAE